MARRSDHTKEQLRTLILDAAEQLIASRGIEGLSARAVADKIGYRQGTIYLHFENLDAVMLGINSRTLARLHAAIEKAVGGRAKALRRLKRAGRAYAAFARDNPHLWRVCFEHRLPEGMTGPADMDAQIAALIDLVRAPIAEAADVRGKTLDTAAQALWSGVHGICILTLTDKLHLAGQHSAEALIDSLVTRYVRGLEAR